MYSVASDGVLTRVTGSPIGVGGDAVGVAFSPNGALLAVADPLNGVWVFTVASGGALTQVAGSPFQLPAGAGAGGWVAFSPNGALLAVGALSGVSMFSVSSGGQLAVAGDVVSPGSDTGGPVAFSPNGALLAQADSTNGVSMFAVGSGGALTQITNETGGLNASAVAFSPNGTLLAVIDDLNGVSVFAVGSRGALTQVSSSPVTTSGNPPGLAFSSNGALLAVATGETGVSVLSVGASGTLTQVSGSPFATGGETGSIAYGPAGLVAATNSEPSNGPDPDSTVAVLRAGPPSVTIATPPFGAVYAPGQVVDADYSCADDPVGPGIARCIGTVADGTAIDTSSLGVHSFTVTATSIDGQATTVTNTYVVSATAGQFGSPVPITSGLTDPLHLTLGDFQHTSHEDLAAINTNAVSLIQGEGGGAFAPPVVTDLPNSDLSDIATLTNPGGDDYAAIADHANDLIDIGLLTPNGFQTVQKLALECAPVQIATGDLTGQAGGREDFAVLCSGGTIAVALAVRLAVVPEPSGGNPTWVVSQTFSPGNVTAIATVPDSTAGGVDIVGTTLSSNDQVGLVTLLPSGAAGRYALSPEAPLVRQEIPGAITPALIDGAATFDAFPGLIVGAVARPDFSPLSDYLGESNGTYKGIGQLPTSSGTEFPTAMTTGFFGNSAADLATAEHLSNGCLITIDTGNGRGTFTAGPLLTTCVSVTDMQVGDLNGDGYDDIAYTDPGNGSGLFVLYQTPPQIVTIGSTNLVEDQPTASPVGLLIQRRGKPRRVEVKINTSNGTKLVKRTVPTLINVGHIPLGPHRKGRNTIPYKLLVDGRALAPGRYIVTLRSLNAKKQVLDLSQPVAMTVDRHERPHFGHHALP